MPNISTTDARGLYTKMLVAVYTSRRRPQSFFRSFFKTVESPTYELSIEVQRGTTKIAVDVELGTEGARNKFSRTTEKIFVPPFYKEFFEVTDLDLYDRLFRDGEVDAAVVNDFINRAADKLQELQYKIDRAIEKMCADVLELGRVRTRNGTLINYGRKAASFPDAGAGNYWTDAAISPYDQLQADMQFIRDNGLVATERFNIILGLDAWAALKANPKFKEQQNFFNMKLDEVMPPQAAALGGTLHGKLTCGPYTGFIWTYQDTYTDPTDGTTKFYMNPKKSIVLPDVTDFALGFGACPQIVEASGGPAVGIQKGQYIFYDFIDLERIAHRYNIMSRPLPIPVAIDTIVTRQAIAAS